MSKNNILFVSEMPPVNTYASSVVFYRHFKYLEKNNFKINILIDANSYLNRKNEIPESWKVFILPNRKWFLPPYQAKGILQKFRYIIYYQLYVKRILKQNQISLMLGFIYGEFLSPFCAFIKDKNPNLPYISFFHDDPVELNFNQNQKRVINNTSMALQASDLILIASKGFYVNWSKFKQKFKILPPVPDFFNVIATTQKVSKSGLVMGYSGSVYNELIASFEKLAIIFKKQGHQILIIGNNEKAEALALKYPNTIVYRSLFETAEAANEYLITNCDGYIIPYPEEMADMPWIKTCFPSKFIQIAQLELPVLIISPDGSALGNWCVENNWKLYAKNYNEDNILQLMTLLKTDDTSSQTVELKHTVFNPAIIHETFYQTIISCIDAKN